MLTDFCSFLFNLLDKKKLSLTNKRNSAGFNQKLPKNGITFGRKSDTVLLYSCSLRIFRAFHFYLNE